MSRVAGNINCYCCGSWRPWSLFSSFLKNPLNVVLWGNFINSCFFYQLQVNCLIGFSSDVSFQASVRSHFSEYELPVTIYLQVCEWLNECVIVHEKNLSWKHENILQLIVLISFVCGQHETLPGRQPDISYESITTCKRSSHFDLCLLSL